MCYLMYFIIAFFSLGSSVFGQSPKDTQTEFPDTNIFGTPQGNYKRQLSLGLPPRIIRAPGVHGRSQQVEFPDTNIFGTPQGNYKIYLQQNGMRVNSKIEGYAENATAETTSLPPETTLFEIDLEKYFAKEPPFTEVRSVDAPGRLYMVRYNRSGKFMLTLSVKVDGKAVLSGESLKKDDYVPGLAGNYPGHVVQLMSDDPNGMRWDSLEWNSTFAGFIAAENERLRPMRPTIEADVAGTDVTGGSKILDGFIFAGAAMGTDALAAELNRSGRLESYETEKGHLLESQDTFANEKYCRQIKFDVKPKLEFGYGKYFGDYSQATLSFDITPLDGFHTELTTGSAFSSKISSSSAASFNLLDTCRQNIYKLIASEKVGGLERFVAADCGVIKMEKKISRPYPGTSYEGIDWQFDSSGVRLIFWTQN